MWRYQSHPMGTPRWLTTAILLLGGLLGLSIAYEGFVALYGLSAFLNGLFFPLSGFVISSHEAIFLGLTGCVAAWAGTWISIMAIRMNGLSARALAMSRLVWLPVLLTLILIIIDRRQANFAYTFTTVWLIGAIATLVLSGIVPWLLLRTAAARQLHSR